MKLVQSKVTYKSFQQKEVNLPSVLYCTIHFEKGLGFPSPLISRRNTNSFMSTQVIHC